MVVLAQLVRASDCGSEGRGFEPHIPPKGKINKNRLTGFVFIEFSQKSTNNNFPFLLLYFLGNIFSCSKTLL